jgi:hypothetical protein
MNYGSRPLINCAGKIYFFGDVHNEADKLMAVLDQVEPLIQPEDHIVFLGDLVDRGEQPALMIQVLVDLTRKYPDQVYFVQGNHDWMLQHYLTTGRHDWMRYLEVTLLGLQESWGLPDLKPDTIMTALLAHDFQEITKRTIPYYETEETIGTHAPLDQGIVYMYGGYHCKDYKEEWEEDHHLPGFKGLLDRMAYDILWQFTSEDLEIVGIDKFRICGHQPTRNHPRIFKDRAFIDTGCGKGPRPLTCMVFPSKKHYQSK